jgi:hypothetical protein
VYFGLLAPNLQPGRIPAEGRSVVTKNMDVLRRRLFFRKKQRADVLAALLAELIAARH